MNIWTILMVVAFAAPIVFGLFLMVVNDWDGEAFLAGIVGLAIPCILIAAVFGILDDTHRNKVSVQETGYYEFDAQRIERIETALDNNAPLLIDVKGSNELTYDVNSGVVYIGNNKEKATVYNEDGTPRNIYKENNVDSSKDARLTFALEQEGIEKVK